MHKSTTKIGMDGGPELLQALGSFATALRYVPDHFRAESGGDQQILEGSRETYKRVVFEDGAQYWIIAIMSDRGAPWVSLIAADPQTGIWFAAAVRRDTIVRVEEFPAELIEKMPEEQRPFGFAAFIQTQQTQNGDTCNGHQTHG